VRVVPLHYGAATDRAALANGRTNVVSGVASRAVHNLLDPRVDLRSDITDYEPPLPVISADARSNTVLVRDRPERLDADVRAIDALDAPEAPIAIDVLIADAGPDTLHALGLEDAAGTQARRSHSQSLIAALRTAPGARMLADSELQTVDGVAVAWERHVERPVATAPVMSDGTAAGVSHQDSDASSGPDAIDSALRIVPTVDARAASPKIMLAAEWRGAVIDVGRAALAPGDALVMIEPVASARRQSPEAEAADRPLARVVILVPHLIAAR
jgi:hypothetical protein